MGAQLFEVGLYKPESVGAPVMIPRVWDEDTLVRSIPWLRLQNLQGRNIYIRPKGEHDLSLVDDLKADSVARMKEVGFQPAVVVETSPGNFQAWLKHPRQLPRDVSTSVARELANRFDGDLAAADWRHFGRLAGLTNRKPRHIMDNGQYPFVRLVESSGRAYDAGAKFVSDVEFQFRERQLQRQSAARTEGAGRTGTLKTIEAFWANPLYGGDRTRSDLAYAIYALAHGKTEGQVAAAIKARDLSHKGSEKRQEEYVDRTVKKAASVVMSGYSR
jgi:hypothetical protein